MCYQGLKTQQAANLAARIQGQERVMGGATARSILDDNGGADGSGDWVPASNPDPEAESPALHARAGAAPSLRSVYGRYYKAAKDLFGARDKVFVPPPISGVNTDQVRVVRVMNPPKMFGLQLKPMVVEATAYGGEDSRMYGLPRWGTSSNGASFYKSQIKE
jgi:hypothetical protein